MTAQPSGTLRPIESFGHLRVAHVIHALAPESGGPSVTVPALCEGLGRLGHDVRLHVTNFGGSCRLVPQNFVLRTHRVAPVGGRLGLSASMHRSVASDAARSQLLHSHGLWLWTNIDAHLTAARMHVPHVLSPRGMLEPYALQRRPTLKRLLWKLLQGGAAQAARCIHVTADSERASVRSMGLTNPIAVVPNGVAIPTLHAREPRPQRRLLFLGRVEQIKGVDLLLRAWTKLAPDFPDWTLDLVGPAQSRFADEMRHLTQQLRTPRVHFRGAAFDDARDRHLASADLFVLPTRSENFGMAVAEALAAGLPVVCTRGAPWHGLEQHRCGFWVETAEAPIEAALRRAMSLDLASLAAMGQRGRQWMRDEFSWESQARKMTATYEWLLGGGPGPGNGHLDYYRTRTQSIGGEGGGGKLR